MGYSVVNIRDLEAGGPTGAVRFVRRELGVEAFVAIVARRGSYDARGLF